MPSIEIEGKMLEVSVRVSRRSRRPRIVVDGRRHVEVVVPPRTSPSMIDALLSEHGAWLARQLAKPPCPFLLGLQRDDMVWIGGLPEPLPDDRPLERWYRSRARAETSLVAAREAERLGVTYRSIAIRDQRTRWGSCSTTGTLSFNWRLVLAPPAILSYVVVHELCHRLRQDHSPAFWGLVAQARPSYREERAWLDLHGSELLAYRVPEQERRSR